MIFHAFDFSATYEQDLQFFLALKDAWYKHPEKSAKLKNGYVPSVTEILGLLGFAPASWTAVNTMRDYLFEHAGCAYISIVSPMVTGAFKESIDYFEKSIALSKANGLNRFGHKIIGKSFV